MSDSTDHDRIVILETQMNSVIKWKDTLTEYLDNKLDRADEKNDQRFVQLDRKFESKVADLQDHVDDKFDWFHTELMSTLREKEAQVPRWVQIRQRALIGIIGASATLIAALIGFIAAKGHL